MATPYDAMVTDEANRQGVDPSLALSIMHQESNGNPNAYNATGATGLMQLLPATAASFGVTDLKDPAQNAKAGVAYLKQGLDKYNGDYAMTAAHYFGGPDQKQWGPKTHQYVADIAARYNKLAASGPATPPPAESGATTVSTAPTAADPSDAFIDAQIASRKDEGTAPAAPTAGATPDPSDAFIDAQIASRESETPPPAGGDDYNPVGDITDKVISMGAKAIGGAVDGIKEGFGSSPLLDTNYFPSGADAPQYSKNIDSVANATVGPIMSLAGRGINALFSGAQGAVAQGVGGPLGNDLAGMMSMPPIPEVAMAAAARSAAPGAIAAPEGVPAAINNLTTPPRAEPVMTRASMPPPAMAANAGAPSNLGAAATPAELTSMTAKEAGAQNTSDLWNHLEGGSRVAAPSPVTSDIPGVKLYAALSSDDPKVAIEHRTEITQNKDYAAKIAVIDQENNAALVEHYKSFAGDDPRTLQAAEAEVSANFDKEKAEVFANKQPVDPSPIGQAIKSVLDNPEQGPRDAIQKAMTSVSKSLERGDATDPQFLYGVHKQIGDMLEPMNPNNRLDRATTAQLMHVQNAINQVIETGAPGFESVMNNFSAQRAPLDAARYMQEKLPGLLSSGGFTPGAFQNFLKGVYKQAGSSDVTLPGRKFSLDQLEALKSIDTQLQRTVWANRSGAVTGSMTAQHTAMGAAAKMLGSHALQTSAALATGGWSVPVVAAAKAGYNALTANRAAAEEAAGTTARVNRLLAAPSGRE